jgi:hypothetical protein
LQVSHQELAEMAAMSRAHVTVTLGKLRKGRLIRYGRNRSLVVNPSLLERYLAGGASRSSATCSTTPPSSARRGAISG